MIIKEPYFCQNASNVYRTKNYIVKQKVSLREGESAATLLISDDIYYARDRKRDCMYEAWFADRHPINGKRIKSAMFTRIYVD
ncbi:MAG: hypothetical protein J5911_00975 [Clostridia bacterium]|nr:hypothetical protein [Clostridia bacterium]